MSSWSITYHGSARLIHDVNRFFTASLYSTPSFISELNHDSYSYLYASIPVTTGCECIGYFTANFPSNEGIRSDTNAFVINKIGLKITPTSIGSIASSHFTSGVPFIVLYLGTADGQSSSHGGIHIFKLPNGLIFAIGRSIAPSLTVYGNDFDITSVSGGSLVNYNRSYRDFCGIASYEECKALSCDRPFIQQQVNDAWSSISSLSVPDVNSTTKSSAQSTYSSAQSYYNVATNAGNSYTNYSNIVSKYNTIKSAYDSIVARDARLTKKADKTELNTANTNARVEYTTSYTKGTDDYTALKTALAAANKRMKL